MSTNRTFAYNTGSTIAGTEQVGSIAIGTPSAGFAATGKTWRLGPNEDPGFVIAYTTTGPRTAGGGSEVISGTDIGYKRSTDKTYNSFVSLANGVGATTFASASAAKTWLTTNGYWTSYDNIVTDNLVVYLNSGDYSSYPGSGSTWTDLAGTPNNATLFNTPTYSSTYEGILQFDDASSEYATIPNIGTIQNWTVEVWVRFTASLNGKVAMVVGNQYNLSTSINFTIGTNGAPGSYNIQAGFFQNGWYNTTGFAPTLNTWYQIVGTYDGSTIRQYVNGVANGGTLNVAKTLQSGGEIRIMRRWDDAVNSSNLFDGDLAIARIYSSALTATQVLQNFNANKSRFGL